MLSPNRLLEDAVSFYEEAQARAMYARETWESAGRPLVLTHANRTQGVHPLLRVLLDCEAHAGRMRAALQRTAHRGPAPSAVVETPVPRPVLRRVR